MRSTLRAVVPVAATAFFLWLALRDVEWARVGATLRRADPFLFAAALVVATLGVHLRALRWRALLEPVMPGVPLYPRVASTAIGLAANNVLPARAGEFARALVCARLTRIPLPAVFGTLAVERALDGMVLVGALVGVVALQGLPGDADAVRQAQAGARVVAAISVVLGLSLAALALFPHRFAGIAERLVRRLLPARVQRPLVDALHAFLGGVAVLRSPRLLATSVAWAVAQWAILAGAYLLAFRALGIPEPGYGGAVFLQSMVALAVALPAAPGFVGTFHFAATYGLEMYGVDADRAAAFAIVFHLGGWLTVTGLGVYYLSRLGLTWRALLGAERRVEEAVEAAEAPARG